MNIEITEVPSKKELKETNVLGFMQRFMIACTVTTVSHKNLMNRIDFVFHSTGNNFTLFPFDYINRMIFTFTIHAYPSRASVTDTEILKKKVLLSSGKQTSGEKKKQFFSMIWNRIHLCKSRIR